MDEEMTLVDLFGDSEWKSWTTLYVIGSIAMDKILRTMIADDLYLSRRAMYVNV